MSSKLTVAPFAEPVDVQDAKDHLRVDLDDDDDLITSLIVAGGQRVAAELRRALVTQTWRLKADSFPQFVGNGRWRFGGRETTRNEIALPYPPLQAVSSISYVDAAGTTQTWSAANYVVDTDSEPGRITPAYGLPWPAARHQAGAVTINFVAGYATPFTADATSNVLTALGRTFTNGDVLRLTNSGGSLPDPLEANTDYYVVNASGATFKLATTANGTAIDLVDGQGTHFASNPSSGVSEIDGLRTAIKMLVTHWYTNRAPVVTGTIATAIPMTVSALLDPYRWGTYR